ncbi:hypothetical protein M885DRAFT_214942 [Pelagophyceae sp. CCMP2097]|nr:hypothetical protein M885DRAFT_214942 [Pelagophyceae sp. CCMP2097]
MFGTAHRPLSKATGSSRLLAGASSRLMDVAEVGDDAAAGDGQPLSPAGSNGGSARPFSGSADDERAMRGGSYRSEEGETLQSHGETLQTHDETLQSQGSRRSTGSRGSLRRVQPSRSCEAAELAEDGTVVGYLAVHWGAVSYKPTLDLAGKQLKGEVSPALFQLLKAVDSFDLRGNDFDAAKPLCLVAQAATRLKAARYLRLLADEAPVSAPWGSSQSARSTRSVESAASKPGGQGGAGLPGRPPLSRSGTAERSSARGSAKERFLASDTRGGAAAALDIFDGGTVIPEGLSCPDLLELEMPGRLAAEYGPEANSRVGGGPASPLPRRPGALPLLASPRTLGLAHLGASRLRRLALPGQRLDGCALSDLLGELAGVRETLRELDLSGSRCGGTLEGLADFPGLCEVFLSGCDLEGGLDGLKALRGARILCLHHNGLDAVARDTFDCMPQLHAVFLHHNKLSGPVPAPASVLASVRHFWLRANPALEPLEWEGFVALTRALPNAEIQLDAVPAPPSPPRGASARAASFDDRCELFDLNAPPASFHTRAVALERLLLEQAPSEANAVPSADDLRLALVCAALADAPDRLDAAALRRRVAYDEFAALASQGDDALTARDCALLWDRVALRGGAGAAAPGEAPEASGGATVALEDLVGTVRRLAESQWLRAVEPDAVRRASAALVSVSGGAVADPLDRRPGEAVAEFCCRLMLRATPRGAGWGPLLARFQGDAPVTRDALRRVLRRDVGLGPRTLPDALLELFWRAMDRAGSGDVSKADFAAFLRAGDPAESAARPPSAPVGVVEAALAVAWALARDRFAGDWFNLLTKYDRDGRQSMDSTEFAVMAKRELQLQLPPKDLAAFFDAARATLAAATLGAASPGAKTPSRAAAAKAMRFGEIPLGRLAGHLNRHLAPVKSKIDSIPQRTEALVLHRILALGKNGTAQSAFREFDADGSGTLCSVEFRRVLRRLFDKSQVGDSDINAIWAGMDSDRSDSVTMDELATYIRRRVKDLAPLIEDLARPKRRASLGALLQFAGAPKRNAAPPPSPREPSASPRALRASFGVTGDGGVDTVAEESD